MRAVAKSTLPVTAERPAAGQATLHPLAALFGGLIEQLAIFIAEKRRAQAAEVVAARLRYMSDTDLARLGITRAEIPEFVRQRIFG